MTVEQLTRNQQAPATMQRSVGAGRLTLSARDGKTRIADLFQQANAKIRIPKSYDEQLEAVLINTSGGMTGGDLLNWEINGGSNTKTTVTTQACEKIYKSQQGVAKVETTISVGEQACVEWLPQETILFDESALHRSIDVQLAKSARFLGLEAVVLGRQAMGEPARKIELKDRWRINRENKLIHADDIAMKGNMQELCASASVLQGAVAYATMIICWPEQEMDQYETLIDALRAACAPSPKWSANIVGPKIVARFVAADMYQLRQLLVPVLMAASRNHDVPKVWRL